MVQEIQAGYWKKFYVYLSGRTNGAHLQWVSRFRAISQREVLTPEDSDYILLFCPISSRVGTDISEALENLPANKGFILVVMHHTFNINHIVADSRRHVNNPNPHLVVDTVFFEGLPLGSNLNEIAWDAITRFLGVRAEVSIFSSIWNTFSNVFSTISNWVLKRKWLTLALFAGGVVLYYKWTNWNH